jgi:hypothetical protein
MPPTLTIVHDEDLSNIAQWAKGLRSDPENGLIWRCNERNFAANDLAFRHLGGIEVLQIFHLVGDYDDTGPNVGQEILDLDAELLAAIPALRRQHWVIHTMGKEMSKKELENTQVLLGQTSVPVTTLAIARSTVKAIVQTDAEVADFCVAILHCISASDIDLPIIEHQRPLLIATASAVVFEPQRLTAIKVEAIKADLDFLIGELKAGNASPAAGSRFIEDLGLAKPTASEHRADTEQSLLAQGVLGNVTAELKEKFASLDADLEIIEPGRWPDLIANTIDQLLPPANTPTNIPGVLGEALAEIGRNASERQASIETTLGAAIVRFFQRDKSIESTKAWIRGAHRALTDAQKSLTSNDRSADVSAPKRETLEFHHNRLVKAVKWLPGTTATATRGLLLSIMVLTGAYVYVPIARGAIWALTLQLPRFSNNNELNAQYWARLLAATLGIALWFWWSAKWRRARRFRKEYIREAERFIEDTVNQRVLALRLGTLDHLLTLVATPGLYQNWLSAMTEAVSELIESTNDTPWPSTEVVLRLPSEIRVASLAQSMDPTNINALEQAAINSLSKTKRTAESSEMVLALRDALGHQEPRVPNDLVSFCQEQPANQNVVAEHLRQSWEPTVDPSGLVATTLQFLIAPRELTIHIGKALYELPTNDPCFASRITLRLAQIRTAEDGHPHLVTYQDGNFANEFDTKQLGPSGSDQ